MLLRKDKIFSFICVIISLSILSTLYSMRTSGVGLISIMNVMNVLNETLATAFNNIDENTRPSSLFYILLIHNSKIYGECFRQFKTLLFEIKIHLQKSKKSKWLEVFNGNICNSARKF